jgi:hypothetical protein
MKKNGKPVSRKKMEACFLKKSSGGLFSENNWTSVSEKSGMITTERIHDPVSTSIHAYTHEHTYEHTLLENTFHKIFTGV